MRCATPICRGALPVAGESLPGPAVCRRCWRRAMRAHLHRRAGARRRRPRRDPGGGAPRRRRRDLRRARRRPPHPPARLRFPRRRPAARGRAGCSTRARWSRRGAPIGRASRSGAGRRWSSSRTGDELVEPGTARGAPGAIPESVSLGVAALAERLGRRRSSAAGGCATICRRWSAPPPRRCERPISSSSPAAPRSARGISPRRCSSRRGLELIFSKVAIKPGKPVWLGRARRQAGASACPAIPTSAMVTARLLLAPLLAGLAGRDPAAALAWSRAARRPARPVRRPRDLRPGALAEGAAVPLANQDRVRRRRWPTPTC